MAEMNGRADEMALKVVLTIACKLRAALCHVQTMDVVRVRQMLVAGRELMAAAADYPQAEWGEGTGISQLSLAQTLFAEVRELDGLARALKAGPVDEREFRRVLRGAAISVDMLLNTHTLRREADAIAAAREERHG